MPTTQPKQDPRTILWIIAGLSLITLIFSSYTLAKRINAFNAERDAPLFSFRDVQEEAFLFMDNPFTIKEVTIDDKPFVQVDYAQDELLLPVVIPPKQPLPTLYDRQREWLSIMILADRAGMTIEEMESKIDSGEIVPRLILATRTRSALNLQRKNDSTPSRSSTTNHGEKSAATSGASISTK